jgi:hypothetical protein
LYAGQYKGGTRLGSGDHMNPDSNLATIQINGDRDLDHAATARGEKFSSNLETVSLHFSLCNEMADAQNSNALARVF